MSTAPATNIFSKPVAEVHRVGDELPRYVVSCRAPEIAHQLCEAVLIDVTTTSRLMASENCLIVRTNSSCPAYHQHTLAVQPLTQLMVIFFRSGFSRLSVFVTYFRVKSSMSTKVIIYSLLCWIPVNCLSLPYPLCMCCWAGSPPCRQTSRVSSPSVWQSRYIDSLFISSQGPVITPVVGIFKTITPPAVFAIITFSQKLERSPPVKEGELTLPKNSGSGRRGRVSGLRTDPVSPSVRSRGLFMFVRR